MDIQIWGSIEDVNHIQLDAEWVSASITVNNTYPFYHKFKLLLLSF